MKHISDMTYTLKIYYIIFQHKEKIGLKYIPDITFTLNIYDIFAMYITYTLKIYDILIQYKEIIFETYTTYSLYFKDI